MISAGSNRGKLFPEVVTGKGPFYATVPAAGRRKLDKTDFKNMTCPDINASLFTSWAARLSDWKMSSKNEDAGKKNNLLNFNLTEGWWASLCGDSYLI